MADYGNPIRVPTPHQQEIDALCRYMDVERGLSPATIATVQPSEPSPVTFAFNVRAGKWEVISEKTPDPIMDNRSLLMIGGMEKAQMVTAKAGVIPLKPNK